MQQQYLWLRGDNLKENICGASNSKMLAVFWYVDGQFLGHEDTLKGDSVEQFGDYLQLDLDHFAEWPIIRMLYNLPAVDYNYYPRGRILFNTKLHKFIVVGSKEIVDDPEVRSKLREYYGLPSTTIFQGDEHYD